MKKINTEIEKTNNEVRVRTTFEKTDNLEKVIKDAKNLKNDIEYLEQMIAAYQYDLNLKRLELKETEETIVGAEKMYSLK